MKILILNASPKKNGATAKVLRSIEKGVPTQHQIELVNISELEVKPCIGCLKCRPDKKCVLPQDDAHRIGKLIMDSDVFIVGTPTYFGNMTGQLKMLFDRCVPIFEYINGANIKPIQKGKKAIVVVTSAAPFPINLLPTQSGGAVKSLKTILRSGGYAIKNVMNIPGTGKFEEKAEKILFKAEKIGAGI